MSYPQEGIDIDEVFNSLESDIKRVDLVVAHNIDFDRHIVLSELSRYHFDDLFKVVSEINTYCTCRKGVDITKIKPRGWKMYKIPRLSELYEHLFDESFGDAHHAEADVNACARCYFKMIKI